MANTSLAQFSGMYPRYQHNVIPDQAAELLIDGEIMSGGLTAIRQNTPVIILDKLYRDMYRYQRPKVPEVVNQDHDYVTSPNVITPADHSVDVPLSSPVHIQTADVIYGTPDGSAASASGKQWLLFNNKVDLARTPVADDKTNMTFITGLGPMRVFDSNTLAETDTTITADNSVIAGIPIPNTPILDKTKGTTEAKRTVSYVIAYARTWKISEKIDVGPASAPAMTHGLANYLDIELDEAAVLSNLSVPTDASRYDIDTILIYRSAITTEGAGSYREVCRFSMDGGGIIPPGITLDESNQTYTFKDEIPDIALGATLTHTNWSAPEVLEGITSLRNGILAAFSRNTLYLSEAYQGHAWPSDYAVVLDFPIVGLGTFGNTLVVLTTAASFMCVVSSPANAILIPLQEAQACVSKESIVNFADCVAYASSYGLIRVNSNGATVVTDKVIGPREWCRYNPNTIQASSYQGRYLAFFDSDQVPYSGFLFDFPTDYAMYTGGDSGGSGIVGLSQKPSCMWHDDAGNDVFLQYTHPVTLKNAIFAFGNTRSLGRIFTWVSKKFLNKYGLTSISAVKVNFQNDSRKLIDASEDLVVGSNTLNGPQINVFSINGDESSFEATCGTFGLNTCQLIFYGDDQEWCRLKLTDNTPIRIPAGVRFDSWYVRIISSEPIARVQFATSIGELE